MIKAIIVEDEIYSAGDLRNLLGKYCSNVATTGIAQTVKQALELIEVEKPDLVFLDVELPDGLGFDIIKGLGAYNFEVIFVSAFDHYALQAIKMCALDYLLKPVDKDELILAIKKMQQKPFMQPYDRRREMLHYNNEQKSIYKQKIALTSNDGLLFVEKEDILYCSADRNYTKFFLKSGEKILVSKPLSYFEEILDEAHFCRTHQSFLVNLLHIRQYMKGKGGHLVMVDGAKVQVSTRMKNNFLQRFAQ